MTTTMITSNSNYKTPNSKPCINFVTKLNLYLIYTHATAYSAAPLEPDSARPDPQKTYNNNNNNNNSETTVKRLKTRKNDMRGEVTYLLLLLCSVLAGITIPSSFDYDDVPQAFSESFTNKIPEYFIKFHQQYL